MNTTFETNTNTKPSVQEAAQAAVNACVKYADYNSTFQPARAAFEKLPKTPKGRLKKDVASAIDAIESTRRDFRSKAIDALEAVKLSLQEAAVAHNARTCSKESLLRVFKAFNYNHNQELLTLAAETYKKSKEYNDSQPRQKSISPLAVKDSPETLFLVNDEHDVLIVLHVEDSGYQLAFAGHHKYSDSPIGKYISWFQASDIGSAQCGTSIVNNGTINLSARGSERTKDAKARLKRIIEIIDVLNALATTCPNVNWPFAFDFIECAHYAYVSHPTVEKWDTPAHARKCLESLANGGGVYSAFIAGSTDNKIWVVYEHEEQHPSLIRAEIIVPRSNA